ncbi:hypothetical protein E4T44_08793 [Aureobasidium sp. EXF-8845]|nr:hypothetical protein E4T44_08793 [Aureobasidium sp. EXF-8845]KAI4846523.1 hypothetical protein E4T45_07210 [Aureobasidium sp. EXF-8846]
MAPSMSTSSNDSITAETIAAHLNHELGLPAAEDLDVDLVKQWIVALDLKLRSKEIKRLAPKVLDELRQMDGITADQAARHQQRYPIKRDTPKTIYTWNGDGSLGAKKETPPESSSKQLSAWEVVGKKKDTKHGKQVAPKEKEEDSDGAVSVKLEEGVSEESVDDAVAKAKAKKEKKAAKKARKLAQALKEAKPSVGPKQEDSDDSGNDSDWTQTSWSPSWASDSE